MLTPFLLLAPTLESGIIPKKQIFLSGGSSDEQIFFCSTQSS
jgi:hypothetical protein